MPRLEVAARGFVVWYTNSDAQNPLAAKVAQFYIGLSQGESQASGSKKPEKKISEIVDKLHQAC
jgi:hypothetical protein